MTLKWKRADQNRNNKRTEIERFDWFIKRIQTRVAFGWLSERSGEKTSCPRTFYKSSDTSLDVILQHDWPIKQRLLHIRVFFGGKTKSPCFDLCIHWLIKQITNTYRNHFSRSYENRCINGISISLIKQLTFLDVTTGFPAQWCLRIRRRNSILMTCHYPHLGSASDWLKQISHAERLIICGWSNQWVDNAIHRINRYPLDNAIGFPNTYPADSYLFSG